MHGAWMSYYWYLYCILKWMGRLAFLFYFAVSFTCWQPSTYTGFPFMIQMTFRGNHCDKTVWLGNMTNVIVINPDYRLAPVYYYSLFLILQVIGNLYFYFPTGCFFFFGHCKHREWSLSFSVFFIFISNILLFYSVCSGIHFIFLFFLFSFFLAWISQKP